MLTTLPSWAALCYGPGMWNDVVDLRDYYASPRGQFVARLTAQRLRDIWPNLAGMRVLGIGFPGPFLDSLAGETERTLVAMPSGQGVLRWPYNGGNLATLADEQGLPFADRSVDRILLVHCLEGSSHLRAMLRECWRILADGGRLLVVVANRRGLWARAEGTPFALGRPFSASQITQLLRDNLFVPVETTGFLFVPPVLWRGFRSFAPMFERAGVKLWPGFAGLLAVEAEKQIYAAPFGGAAARAKRKRILARPAGGDVGRSRDSI